MKVHDIRSLSDGSRATLSARIVPESTGEPFDLWFRFDGLKGPVSDYADPFVAALLPVCMLEGETCTIEGPISATLKRNAAAAQTILDDWYGFLRPVAIESATCEADRRDAREACAPGVACCFSGGVDSWFSLLQNRDEVSHLLLVRGFDIGLSNDPLWRATLDRATEVAAELGLELITCETNLRQAIDPRHRTWGRSFDDDFWGQCLHGAALASVVLSLRRTVSSLIIPATHKESELKPWGSSPFLDPYWSNGKVSIRHHGCEDGRVEKVFSIAREPLALRNLRVCHNDVAEINCGLCEKCVRTMLALDLRGALNRAETFPDRGSLRKLRRMEVPRHLFHHYESLLETAQEMGEERLARELEIILDRRFSAEKTLARTVRWARRFGHNTRRRLAASDTDKMRDVG